MQAGKALFQSLVWRGLYYLTAFILNILIAREFQASVSGSIYYISSIYALILLFASLSLDSGIIYFTARKEIPVNKLFSFSLLWSLLTGLMTFIAVYFFLGDAYKQIPEKLLIFSAVTFILGNMLTTYCGGFFYAHNNYAVPNAVNIICTILLIVLVPYYRKSIPSLNNDNYFYVYFASFLFQGICIAVAAGIKYIKKGMLNFLSLPEFRLLFGYCVLAFTGNIIHFLLYRVDYWFVSEYCTAEQLGNYIQVSKLAQMFFILPTILASAVFPMTAGGHQINISSILTRLSRCVFLCYLILCGVLALTGKWLFPAVFGESFSEMYDPFLLLIPGILALSGIFTLTAYFAGKNMIRTNITGSVMALAVIFTGDIIFIPRYGINAAALVSSIGYIVYQVYVIVIFNREYKTTVADFFVFRITDLKILANNLINLGKNK
jgi:O-antigen/teichoic acid export membrane protein